MNYLRSLFLNFLIVFFVDRMAPGIEISYYENVPNIGADLLFSAVVGFLNASVFFVLLFMESPVNRLKLGLITFIISFVSFILIAVLPFGITVVNVWGVIIGGSLVWAVAFLTNYLEWQHYEKV